MIPLIQGLLISFLIVMGIQILFFIFAAWFKTDKVTDLSYGLTFVILAFILLILNKNNSIVQYLFFLIVSLWGLRLASYLFVRILKMGKDSRFDGIRENFWSFAKFWLLQGISIFVIMLPVIIVLLLNSTITNLIFYIGIFIWLCGLIIESVADYQKNKFYKTKESKTKWISSGLWKYSRHPNYFGELLCWWGIFIAATPFLSGWMWLSIIGPLWITNLLLNVTGIPLLEKKADEKFKHNGSYEQYKRRTSILIPMPRKKN